MSVQLTVRGIWVIWCSWPAVFTKMKIFMTASIIRIGYEILSCMPKTHGITLYLGFLDMVLSMYWIHRETCIYSSLVMGNWSTKWIKVVIKILILRSWINWGTKYISGLHGWKDNHWWNSTYLRVKTLVKIFDLELK